MQVITKELLSPSDMPIEIQQTIDADPIPEKLQEILDNSDHTHIVYIMNDQGRPINAETCIADDLTATQKKYEGIVASM